MDKPLAHTTRFKSSLLFPSGARKTPKTRLPTFVDDWQIGRFSITVIFTWQLQNRKFLHCATRLDVNIVIKPPLDDHEETIFKRQCALPLWWREAVPKIERLSSVYKTKASPRTRWNWSVPLTGPRMGNLRRTGKPLLTTSLPTPKSHGDAPEPCNVPRTQSWMLEMPSSEMPRAVFLIWYFIFLRVHSWSRALTAFLLAHSCWRAIPPMEGTILSKATFASLLKIIPSRLRMMRPSL